jgi:hypothetical protein
MKITAPVFAVTDAISAIEITDAVSVTVYQQ